MAKHKKKSMQKRSAKADMMGMNARGMPSLRNVDAKISKQMNDQTEMLKKQIDVMQRKIQKNMSDAKKKFLDAEKTVRGYVSSNPERALLIAAGVGAAIGSALTFFAKRQRR